MAYLFLFLAIALEIVGSLSLKASQGMTKLLPTILMFVGFAAALGLMAHVTTKLPLNVTYPTFAAVGTAGAVIGSYLLFGERLSWQQLGGIVLIIFGVIAVTAAPANA
ncbi:MAG: SMR family transporter [Hyphomicrobiales bacterium]|nr:SMR family transporter [Hyphomicrobiales bacterium]